MRLALEQNPNLPVAYLRLGELWLEAATIGADPVAADRAVAALESVVKMDPSNGHAALTLGQAYLAMDDEARGFAELKRATQITPIPAEAHRLLGDLYRARKNHAAAVTAYHVYLKLRGDTPPVLERLGDTYVELDNPSMAAETYLKLASLEPGRVYTARESCAFSVGLRGPRRRRQDVSPRACNQSRKPSASAIAIGSDPTGFFMSELLAVFARAPELGRVKTRLCPPLTSEEALELHTALVADSLDHFGRVERPGLERALLLSQPLLDPQDLSVPEGWTVSIQSDGDLGERLASLFQSAFRSNVTRLVVVGSDSPTLPRAVIHDAFDDLERRKVVVGSPQKMEATTFSAQVLGSPKLFQNIDWGTGEVLSQTTAVLTGKKLDFATLIPWYDIDRGKDLEKLRGEIGYLKRSAPDLVPARVAAALPSSDAPEFTLDRDF